MPTALALPAELSIYTVGELRPQWMAWLMNIEQAGHGEDSTADLLRVDASAVGEVDAAGAQLLLSLANALTRRQRLLHCINPSQPLVSACEALGLAHLVADSQPHGANQ